MWNEKDPILKERLFGLTNFEGNHGEDVKEYYYYLDAVPTNCYLKYLYKYPQAAFPYDQLRIENKKRTRHDPEYELIDTGVFNENRYFDVFRRGTRKPPLKTFWFESPHGIAGPSLHACTFFLRYGSGTDGIGATRMTCPKPAVLSGPGAHRRLRSMSFTTESAG